MRLGKGNGMRPEIEEKLGDVETAASAMNNPMGEVNETILEVNHRLKEAQIGLGTVIAVPGRHIKALAYNQFEHQWQVGVQAPRIWQPLTKAKRLARYEALRYLPLLLSMVERNVERNTPGREEDLDGTEQS